MTRSTLGIPLRWIISLGVMLITLVLSATLITRSYLDQRDLLLAATETSARLLADSLDNASLRLLAPVQSSAQLLVYDPLVQADSLQQRLQRLPSLVQVLRTSPVVSAVYVGYGDHDFLLVRDLNKPIARERVAAPADAQWMVQSIDHLAGGGIDRNWLFYSDDLRLLERRDVPNYRFDPASRVWYRAASQTSRPVLTAPYLFFTTREVGVTLSLAAGQGTVVGIDASVEDISVELSRLQPAPEHRLAVVNSQGVVVAWPQVEAMLIEDEQGVRLADLTEMDAPELMRLQALAQPDGRMIDYTSGERDWYGVRLPLLAIQGESLELLMSVPADTLLSGLRNQGRDQVFWSLLVTLAALLAGWGLAYRLTRPLDRLSLWVQALTRFDFRRESIKPSGIREVNELSRVLGSMARTIRHFQAISHTLARERQLDRMLPGVADHLKASVQASDSAIYLYDADARRLTLASLHQDRPNERLPEHIPCAESGAPQQREAVEKVLPAGAGSWLVTPLQGREAQPSGVMVLRLPQDVAGDDSRLARFVDELSGSAATAIETRQLIDAQKCLLDAIIHLLADAIDAKSSHTSGHCERVPELAQMLMDAACRADQGPFADFAMNQAERYEFHLAAWLHDCGKITTPEYVLDKGTKLETLHNRIHEIRTRFEVLWRDAEIRYLKARLERGDDGVPLQCLQREQAELQADFERVARINIGSETLSEQEVEAVRAIGVRTWLCHFDRRLGLSETERRRLPDEKVQLPVRERLLDDRPEHLLPWNGRRPPVERDNPDNRWGFDMVLPEYERNLGELHNLTQPYGTLTPEERFCINNHIVQTVRMLDSLPWPASLRRVPEIAGNHHERMDGRGYPRRLPAGDLSVAERVMALADVFEALTAADRPYKKAKTLSESLHILALMVREGHLDRRVFGLFLDAEVYRAYADRYLAPEQADEIDPDGLWQLATGEESRSHAAATLTES